MRFLVMFVDFLKVSNYTPDAKPNLNLIYFILLEFYIRVFVATLQYSNRINE